MTPEDLKKRTKRFALSILRLCDELPRSAAGRAIANQLVRAGTSVAANYRAACRARSQADFVSKIGLVEEEADETAFWIELLMDAEMIGQSKLAPLAREADELTRIMVASGRKVRPRS